MARQAKDDLLAGALQFVAPSHEVPERRDERWRKGRGTEWALQLGDQIALYETPGLLPAANVHGKFPPTAPADEGQKHQLLMRDSSLGMLRHVRRPPCNATR